MVHFYFRYIVSCLQLKKFYQRFSGYIHLLLHNYFISCMYVTHVLFLFALQEF